MTTKAAGVHHSLADVPSEVQLTFDLEGLKELDRQNPLSHNPRRENVAEHSWHVAAAAVLLADHSPEPIDIAHAVLLAVVHDVVELFVGDTFAFGDGVRDQATREQSAMARLRDTSSAPAIKRLVEIWEEYEAQESTEARFVKGLDTFLPIVQNHTNIKNSSWVRHRVAASKVLKRLAKVEDNIGELAHIGRSMILDARDNGYLT